MEWLTVNAKTDKQFGNIKTFLHLASKRAGISKRITHHALRHTFSVLLQES
jgi:site-specific recombinase XerD